MEREREYEWSVGSGLRDAYESFTKRPLEREKASGGSVFVFLCVLGGG